MRASHFTRAQTADGRSLIALPSQTNQESQFLPCWVFIKDILSNRYIFIYTHSVVYAYYGLCVCLYIDIYCTFIYIFIICLFVIYKSSSLA